MTSRAWDIFMIVLSALGVISSAYLLIHIWLK